jgi:hypothetical protein
MDWIVLGDHGGGRIAARYSPNQTKIGTANNSLSLSRKKDHNFENN